MACVSLVIASLIVTAPAVDIEPARQALLAQHPDQSARINTGLQQVQAMWRSGDGDARTLQAFAVEHFVVGDEALDRLFVRLERALEHVDGHLLEIGRELRAPVELDLPAFDPPAPVDALLAGWDVSAHVLDDAFAEKIAFVVLLNFPQSTLEARLAQPLSRRAWAIARLTGRFGHRVPADVQAGLARASAAADRYIAGYNLWMHHVLGQNDERSFPKDKRLISHWNLRDEIKAQYSQGATGALRQRTIVRLMERIIEQRIPASVIDAPWLDYNPFTNVVTLAPESTREKPAPATAAPSNTPELQAPVNRYQQLLAQFRAARAVDPFSPTATTAIDRVFVLERELPEARVERLFLDVLESPLVPAVAAEIERRLGRRLEPQDLWYDGFKARAALDEGALDRLTRRRYPDAAAFKNDLPRILRALGFDDETARFLSEHIEVDPAQGAGHALQAARRGDKPRLRTRIEADGMDYKGYNIAIHELGHNVEQVFSLYRVDSTLLAGVPGNAFTEAIAFVFQARDLDLLGLSSPERSSKQKQESALADLWATWEIAGVALVDVAVWRWLYDHPQATPEALRNATVRIAGDVWKTHYAPILGGIDDAGRPTPLLAIYSHMIAYPLYLADYPLGHLIARQIEAHLEHSTTSTSTTSTSTMMGEELERMCVIGNIAPDAWMQQATGAPISAAPLLQAAAHALKTIDAASPPPSTK